MKVREILDDCSQWLPSADYETGHPKVTVILPTFRRNKGGYLKRAIDSVLNQSFRRLELIVVDDCSTDGSFDLIKDYMENDPRVSCIRHTFNVGLPAISEYEGYLRGRGEFFAYLFDDNEWYPTALAQTYDLMLEEGAKASFGVTEIWDPRTNDLFRIGQPTPDLLNDLPFRNIMGNGAVMLHREVVETIGLYDPHLSLTRICDWDLWQRISQKYEFLATGIPFTREHGNRLDDSLGNAFKLDYWFSQEHMRHRDESLLLPENYLDIDISVDDYPHSVYFCDCMEQYLLQYQHKHWYQGSDAGQLRRSDKCRRVLVSIPGGSLNACYHNFYRCRDPYLTIFFKADANLIPELQLADALIVARGMAAYQALEYTLSEAKIPVYYYTDDNFLELAKDYPSNQEYAMLARALTAEKLQKLDGVIVTTQELKQSFQQNALHENIIQLDAVARAYEVEPSETVEGKTTIAFMGGSWRSQTFHKLVLPALRKISEKHRIHLVTPKEGFEELTELASESFQITQIPRNINFELVLNQYYAYQPNILIHCGNNSFRNNPYKTKNALLNAAAIGAALVASDIEPYCFREEDEPEQDYILVENSRDAWYNSLLDLVENPEKCRAVFERGSAYCTAHYASERIWADLAREFQQKPVGNYIRYLKQAESAIWHSARSGGGVIGSHINRSYIPDELCPSGNLKGKRTYGITCTSDTVTRVGMLFAVFSKCTGTCRISLSKHGQLLAEGSILMEAIDPNAYNFFLLSAPLQGQYLELLDMTVEVKDTSGEGHIEVFEHRKKRTFWYKVFNRLGMPLKGRDTLFVDLS